MTTGTILKRFKATLQGYLTDMKRIELITPSEKNYLAMPSINRFN